jgi:hypothetical protein
VSIRLRTTVVSVAFSLLALAASEATELPHIKMEHSAGQLIVNGPPFYRPHIYRVRLYSIPAERTH